MHVRGISRSTVVRKHTLHWGCVKPARLPCKFRRQCRGRLHGSACRCAADRVVDRVADRFAVPAGPAVDRVNVVILAGGVLPAAAAAPQRGHSDQNNRDGHDQPPQGEPPAACVGRGGIGADFLRWGIP